MDIEKKKVCEIESWMKLNKYT